MPMAHLIKDGDYGELADIGDVTATSPFMQPEFCLESRDIPVTRKMQRSASSSGSLRGAGGGVGAGSIPAMNSIPTRPASPGLPKFMKNEDDGGEEALYVRVADLPREVQRQVLEGSEEAVLQGVAKPAEQKQQLPLKEPTRLSAQPTDEEIQMSLAQVDLATLMETRAPPPAPAQAPTPASAPAARRRNPARAEAAARLKAMMDRHPLGRRAPSPAPLHPPNRWSHLVGRDDPNIIDPYDVSSSSSDGSDQAVLDCASKMQQLLRELSMSKRNAAAAATAQGTSAARLKAAMSAPPGAPIINPPVPPPPPPPPSAPLAPAASGISAMADQARGAYYDEFIDNVSALSASGPTYRSSTPSAPATRGFGHASDHDDNLSAKGRELARAYQSPVWTHNSGANLINVPAEPRRIRYQSNWSSHSEEEYEILQDPQQQQPPMQIPYHAPDGREPLSSSSDTDSQPGGVAN